MSKQIRIINCGSGNLHSVAAGMARAAAIGDYDVTVITEATDLQDADYIVLPGQGAFADCMRGLTSLPGMREALEERVLRAGVPYLGICVGMQMLLEQGREHGDHAGLGWIAGEVVPITPGDPTLKIPHMGWNELQLNQPDHPFFAGIEDGAHVYFVHSYHARCTDPDNVLATADYGETLTAVIGKDNIIATQFHPEKSHHTGQTLLENFLRMS